MVNSVPAPSSPNNPTGPTGGTYVCEICNTAYNSKKDLEIHNNQSHPDRKIEDI